MIEDPPAAAWPETAHVPAIDDPPGRGGDPARAGPLAAAAFRVTRPELVAAFQEGRARAAQLGGVAATSVDPEPDPLEMVNLAKEHARRAAVDRMLDAGWQSCLSGLEGLDPVQQPDALIRWLADPDALILLLIGPVGTGKTHAAYATAVQAARAGLAHRTRNGAVVTRKAVPFGTSQIGYTTALRPDGADAPPWLVRSRARDADLLVLDDFGAELDTDDATATQHARTEIVELLDARWTRRGRVILTTNLKPSQIARTFGERIASRIVHRSTRLLYDGPDRRAEQFPDDWNAS